jgi:hypothetical protein
LARGNQVTNEEFVQQLQRWQQELVADVISHYQNDDRRRGDLAFVRWKERFAAFLNTHTPSEAVRFAALTSHMLWYGLRNETPYSEFMRVDGKNCLAFIQDLTDASMKGYIVIADGEPRKPQGRKQRSSAGQIEEVNVRDSEEARNLKSLIDKHKSRLRILKEQEAIQGITVDPKVPIEIKEIESKIRKLQPQLRALL